MTATSIRTARIPHPCDSCHWTPSLRGVATILPGHRYLIHTAFPGDAGHEEGQRPAALKECVACAADRTGDDPIILAVACGAYCCALTPCALPVRHGGEHSCRRCAEDRARDERRGAAR